MLGGDYPRRDDDRDASVTEDVKAAAASYRDTFRDSPDPLVTLARRAAGGAADLVGSAARGARGWAGGRGRGEDDPPASDLRVGGAPHAGMRCR